MDAPAAILRELVSFRTDVEGHERPLAEHLAARLGKLGADDVILADVPRAAGNAASYVYARFGAPRVLVNAHLDTVPANAGWSTDPWTPHVKDGRIYALGAADTKGAAAAILAALADERPKDTAILFSGDEETTSVVMRAFVESELANGLERAIVCEPTNLRAGTRHRGIASFEVSSSSVGGHSSKADAMPSPIGDLARVAVALDDWGRARRGEGPKGFEGMCLNLARLDGGVAFNVVPTRATLEVSLRPPPGADVERLYAELEALVARAAPSSATRFTRRNAPFATRDLSGFAPMLGPFEAVDLGFWTEAALLVERGVDAVVFGPGDIAQAHAPDEWVAIDELDRAAEIFRGTFRRSRA